MKCQKCGTDIPEGKIYCEKCGSAIQMVPDYNPVDDISIDTDTPDAQPDMEATSKPDTEEQPQPRKIHWKRWAVGILLLVLGGYTTYQIAYRSFGSVQETAEDEIILLEKPEFSTSPGCYTHSLQLILSHTDRANGVIYYTLDGSTPDADSSVYNGPITIEEGTTVVRTVFIRNDGVQSEEADGTYKVMFETPDEPVFSVPEGTYNGSFYVTIRAGAESNIYYTTNGEEPDRYATRYTGPIQINPGLTVLQAVAVDYEDRESGVVEVIYRVNELSENQPVSIPADSQSITP